MKYKYKYNKEIITILVILLIVSIFYYINIKEDFTSSPTKNAVYCSKNACLLGLPYTYGILAIIGIIVGCILLFGIVAKAIGLGNHEKAKHKNLTEQYNKYRPRIFGENQKGDWQNLVIYDTHAKPDKESKYVINNKPNYLKSYDADGNIYYK